MGTYILRHLVYGVITIFLISIVTFLIVFPLPTGNPALRIAGKSPTPELFEAIRAKYHLRDAIAMRADERAVIRTRLTRA